MGSGRAGYGTARRALPACAPCPRACSCCQLTIANLPNAQSATPKAVLIPASEHSLNGDNAFGNSFSDLSVDVGRNPGAIAISYLVNNQGAIERVALRGSGHIGLALLRPTLGPGLISELTVDGFAMGIAAAGPCCSMVFEHILLRNQSVAGSEDQPSL